ncbi:FliH/SctL family protein [Leifsonia poae]|uniref:FliH/SctL family protein n=1 Tax=Leifsonia poae TaxID=110933 RepID=UPI001CBCE6CA|nr:FliH/SctL family protein [Leifsonia poae]
MSNELAFAPVPIPVLAETEFSQTAATAARSRGFATGYAEGLRAAATEQAAWISQAEARQEQERVDAGDRRSQNVALLRAAALELSGCTLPPLAEVDAALVSAAFELAEAVVGAALADRVAAARAAIVRVLEADTGAIVSRVRLNPDDIRALGDDAIAELTADGALTVVADPALASGDAIGELPDGWLDARIGTALARAREAIV